MVSADKHLARDSRLGPLLRLSTGMLGTRLATAGPPLVQGLGRAHRCNGSVNIQQLQGWIWPALLPVWKTYSAGCALAMKHDCRAWLGQLL